jgi:hypothetical protein
VDEHSHKQDMAAALRGDFARLRARGVATTFSVPREQPADGRRETGDVSGAAPPSARRGLRRLRRR